MFKFIDKIDDFSSPKISNPSTSVSEEQLLKAKILEDGSEYFHSEDKGCEMEESTLKFESKSNWTQSFIKIKFCKTHNKKVCRCGWQIHHHYGTDSLKLAGARVFHDKDCIILTTELHCEYCGEEFYAMRKDAKYCKNCRKYAAKERSRERLLKRKQLTA